MKPLDGHLANPKKLSFIYFEALRMKPKIPFGSSFVSISVPVLGFSSLQGMTNYSSLPLPPLFSFLFSIYITLFLPTKILKQTKKRDQNIKGKEASSVSGQWRSRYKLRNPGTGLRMNKNFPSCKICQSP